MKLERISSNQIKYFISFDELTCKGFNEEDMLKEPTLWDALFDEMLDEASKIYELEACEAVSVEIYSMTSKELVLILTLDEDDVIDNVFSPLTNQLPKNDRYLIVSFEEIDHCILLAKTLIRYGKNRYPSTLYVFKEHYYLYFTCRNEHNPILKALCEEYGSKSQLTVEYIREYGQLIIDRTAIQTLDHYF